MSLIVERVTLNPITENTLLAPLDLAGLDPSWGIYLLSHDYPAPEQIVQHSGNAETEGEPVVQTQWGNRTITARVRIFEPTDPASTNLAQNPTAANGLSLGAGIWEGISLVSLINARPASLPQGMGIDSVVEAKSNAASDAAYLKGINVTSGKTYRASLYVQLVAKTSTAAYRIVVYNELGEVKATGGTLIETVTGEYVRLDVAFTADSTANWRVGVQQVNAGTGTVYITGVLVEESANLTPYFSGDSPGCDWSGQPHGSTSTRPAPDGTRFSHIVRDLTEQIDRTRRQKYGFLRRISALGGPLVYDLQNATFTDAPQDLGIGRRFAEIGLSFEALPGGRAPEVLVATAEETTKPALSFLAEGVPGEMLGLGRLVLTDKQNVNQLAAWWGQQQRYYPGSVASAELFYEAESRTPLGTSATAELTGASGAGKNTVLQGGLVNAYQGVVSTQASGGGSHLSHAGSYRVLARVFRPTTNTGEVSMKFVWTEGDFVNVNENLDNEVHWKVEESEGVFTIEDCGVVTLARVPNYPSGQRWEGRFLAKSTVAGDDIYIDCFMLIPIDEGSGEARASTVLAAPSALTGFDTFDGVVGGALATHVAGIGGTWTGEGDADDFTVDTTNHRAQRTALSDVSGTPRYALLGTTKYTDTAIKALVGSNNPADEGGSSVAKLGVLARYVDTNNWLGLFLYRGGIRTLHVGPLIQENLWYGMLLKKVAGVVSVVSAPIEETGGSWGSLVAALNGTTIQGTIELTVLANGEWRVGFNGKQLRSGTDAVLNPTGALKEGKIGLVDEKLSALAETRFYDSVEAWVPTVDQAIFAGQQLEIRSDRVRRQDSTGSTWGAAPYEGNYLLVQPAGPEKAVTRIIAKGSRNPDSDGGIDDLKAQLYVTPRYLLAPPT